MDAFRRIAEQRIHEAAERGEFENLEGRGRPLDFSEDRRVPRELRSVYRVLKHANCLPPEVELRKEIRSLEELLPRIQDEGELRRHVDYINERITVLNMLTGRGRGHTVSGEMAQHYAERYVARLRERGGR